MPDPFKVRPESFSLQVGVGKSSNSTFGKSTGDDRIMFINQANHLYITHKGH